jgi:hypothetical protein
MKIGFVFAAAAATAMFAAQPVMAGGTLSSDSLPSVHAKTQAPLAGKSRLAARKGSRVGDAEGAFPAFIGSPFFIVGGLAFTGLVFDAIGIWDIGIFSQHVGPYGSVTA